MEYVYPAGPELVPENLTQPSKAYKRHAWLAMGMLLLFVALYVALSGWFVMTAFRLLAGGGKANALLGIVSGLCAAFLAVFMIKALFFVKRGSDDAGLEIKREEQPRLFLFLDRLADEAGAPRPHRVFLSPRVNAAVYYDLSIFNLLFPSKKNLEIGLALVNVLTLPEFKAVCAHEFGHFAQRSMAVGRWVYISHQIVAHIVGKRDALDRFLQGLSRTDFRVAWIGWILSLIVWSIRSLMETAFRLVLLAQRALSREMEMQADLVAVSLTGSDELINALYRLGAADDAWNRTADFIRGQVGQKRLPQDAFAIQLRIIERMGRLHNVADYGQPPSPPADDPAGHRIFASEFAQPPKMWLTHPLNHEREANAKQIYVAAPTDSRSAWEIFDHVPMLKEKVTALLRGEAEAETISTETALEVLDDQFDREHLKPDYRGLYWGRSTVRWANAVEEFQQKIPAQDIASTLDSLYPASIADDLARLKELEREKGMLEAVHQGFLSAQGKHVRYRERDIPKKEIPSLVAELEREIAPLAERLRDHDRLCRSAHRAAARLVGQGWDEYLEGLLRILHFADHGEADLRDVQGCLSNVVAIETATRRVSQSGVDRIMAAAIELHKAFVRLDGFSDRQNGDGTVTLDAPLAARLNVQDWATLVGKHGLAAPSRGAIGEWLNVVDSWVAQWANALSSLRQAALDELLTSERRVAEAFRAKAELAPAAAPSGVPAKYALLLPGKERKRQTRLDWWARFQTADGLPATIGRLIVAGGIVGAVLGMGSSVGDVTVTVYNGLGRTVVVKIGDQTLSVPAFSSNNVSVKTIRELVIEARDEKGHLIESFTEDGSAAFQNYVYNVASASPLIQWSAAYGSFTPQPESRLGAKRWLETKADDLFKEPPRSIQTKGNGGYRQVLSGFGNGAPGQLLDILNSDDERKAVLLQHARWDSPHAPYVMEWLEAAANLPEATNVLAERLSRDPDDVVARRMEQSLTEGSAHRDVCARHAALAAAAPDSAPLRYLVDRCIADSSERGAAYLSDHKRWPKDPWLAYAAGYRMAEAGQWKEALVALESACRGEPALANSLGLDMARIRRLAANRTNIELTDLVSRSSDLQRMLRLEAGDNSMPNELKAYADLAAGNLDQALRKVQGTAAEPRLVRLAAASEGARPDLIRKALALSFDQGIDANTFWTSLALAAREHQNLDSYLGKIPNEKNKEASDAMLHFIDRLRASDPAGAARQLDSLPLELRGAASSMGVIYFGQNAPQTWRSMAKLYLFAAERPYFK